ncbi:Leucine-rich repeat [Arabidopsis thaliana x Arabidopsis arenosa]|uniref:Leucine-rich repeat n=1 Tax=Arabidopsis thaliana x Arabidopsis arenosa TaxID=1240361 RepID=A0A8T2BCU6_9BRAS|nr:Leucine-rich repeat [Arabidopsis thaliana x Arabidopsis arenosa]
MALWIASYFGKQKETFIVQARVGLLKIPKVKDWGAVRRMSLNNNDIEEITCGSKCSELTTLFLQENQLKNLSGEFIQSMQKLAVLDLSELLPVGFQELKKLAHLNLASTERLCSISGISKLSSLKILKLRNSKVHIDASLVKELQLLEHLQVLTITITDLAWELLLGDERLANCINLSANSRIPTKVI